MHRNHHAHLKQKYRHRLYFKNLTHAIIVHNSQWKYYTQQVPLHYMYIHNRTTLHRSDRKIHSLSLLPLHTEPHQWLQTGGRGFLAGKSSLCSLCPCLLGSPGQQPGVLRCLCSRFLSPLLPQGREVAFALDAYRSYEALDLGGLEALRLALLLGEGPTDDVLADVILLCMREMEKRIMSFRQSFLYTSL